MSQRTPESAPPFSNSIEVGGLSDYWIYGAASDADMQDALERTFSPEQLALNEWYSHITQSGTRTDIAPTEVVEGINALVDSGIPEERVFDYALHTGLI